MEFKYKQLGNGLTIIGEVNLGAQSAAVGFFVRTGSRDETPQISGVSHFLEHMLFKGTEALSALEVNEAFDRLGAKFNAFTSEENTVYYAAVLPEYLEAVTDLWSQLMRPTLRQDDFDMEKQVILEEIAMYLDMPDYLVFDRGRELFFKDHPCGNSVLGSIESITSLTAEQMRSYFHMRYAPNNITLACCGNFDFERLCRQVERHCGQWNSEETTRTTPPYRGTRKSSMSISPD
jgi:predicted Zn-dependent peptidase